MPAPEMLRNGQNPRGEGYRLRESLLDAADRLLEAHGADRALSLRAVAREAGVSAQAVYAHFAGLDDLLVAVQERRFTELAQVLERPAGQERGLTFLRAASIDYCRWALAHPRIYQSFFGAVRSDLGGEAPAGPLPGGEVFTGFAEEVAFVLRQRPDPPPPDMMHRSALHLWLTLHGAVSLRMALPHFSWPPIEMIVDDALSSLPVKGRPVEDRGSGST